MLRRYWLFFIFSSYRVRNNNTVISTVIITFYILYALIKNFKKTMTETYLFFCRWVKRIKRNQDMFIVGVL